MLDTIATDTALDATSDLVGRSAELEQIQDVLLDPSNQPCVVIIRGPGGFGKTRLSKAALDLARKVENVLVASEPVDVYDVPTHTSNGLADELAQMIDPARDRLENYWRERDLLERLRVSGDVAAITAQRLKTLEVFVVGVAELARKRRIVFALDTAERLYYGISHMPDLVLDMAESWRWLTEVLPTWRNVVLLVAGRDEMTPLLRQLDGVKVIRQLPLRLKPFTEAETFDYFRAVQRDAESKGRRKLVDNLTSLEDEHRRQAHAYSGGRPILLSLIVDLLAIASFGQLPVQLREVGVSNAAADEEALPSEIEEKLEHELIERLAALPEIGETLIALGRLPKGSDRQLLAQILETSAENATDRLLRVKGLACVKVRRGRTFLHDELYDMLARHVYGDPFSDAATAARVEQAILAYYEGELQSIRLEMDRLYAPVEIEGKGRESLDLQRLADADLRRRNLLAELVYYLLRIKPERGFKRLYRYLREAILSGDVLGDTQLQAEASAFIDKEFLAQGRTSIGGLDLDILLGLLKVRPIARAWAERKFDVAIEEAQALRGSTEKFVNAVPSTPGVVLVWEANSRIMRGKVEEDDLHQARALLNDAIEHSRTILEDLRESGVADTDVRVWRAHAVLAFALRVSGYEWWNRGLNEKAEKDFREAVRLWRDLNVQAELANSLNELGFVMSEQAQWADAAALVQEALDLRRWLGPRARVALSVNTLGVIRIRDGAYDEAVKLCGAALSLFQGIENRRGIGLALIALAEARRRLSPSLNSIVEQIGMLSRARSNAREAYRIFSEHSPEQLRRVEALIEEGCACRDLVRIYWGEPDLRQGELAQLVAESDRLLRRAAEEAGTVFRYRKVDALINRAWLGYHAKDNNLLQDSAVQAEREIGPEYRITEQAGRSQKTEDKLVKLWPQLAKLHMLYGHRAFDQFREAHRAPDRDQVRLSDHLAEAARNYTLALEYNALYSPDSWDMRRVKEQIYQRLKELTATNPKLLDDVVMAVATTENRFKLGSSQMREFMRRRAFLD